MVKKLLVTRLFLARICSLHFNSAQFEVSLKQKLLLCSPLNARNLKVDAIPTENLPGNSQNLKNIQRRRTITEDLAEKSTRQSSTDQILLMNSNIVV